MAEAYRRAQRGRRAIARWARDHLALWIVSATAVNAAATALVTLFIELPGQSGATISGLILVLLILLTVSVALPVTGYMVNRRDREAGQDRTRRDRLSHLLIAGSSASLPQLSEVSDDVLGVTPTRYSAEGRGAYVSRQDVDVVIRRLVSAAGPPYPFVIVWGTTKAGKSRTLAEALRAAFAHGPRVVLPRGGQDLAELSRLGLDELSGPRPALVVLDDLTPADLEALTPEVLRLIRGWAVIVATMTAQSRADVLKTGSEVGAVARAALASVSGEYELPSGPPVGAEKAAAERKYPGERFHGSIAETLVGAGELIARYKASPDSNPAGCAIMRAAIDVRRAGVSRPVTEPELRRLFPRYLREVRVDLPVTGQRFAGGIQWAARPVASQVALLRRSEASSAPPAWTVFDHAVTADEGHADYQRRPMPPDTWTELIDLLPARDTFAVGTAAYTAGEVTAAVAAMRKASTDDDPAGAPMAALGLGILLGEQNDFHGARIAYDLAIESGHPDWAPRAALNLGILLAEQGDFEGAQAAYQLVVDSGHHDQAPAAALNLGNLLSEKGDAGGARAAYQLAIDSGRLDQALKAGVNLGILLGKEGDVDGAIDAYQQVIDSGHADAAPTAAASLGLLLSEQGDVTGARAAYRLAIESGHVDMAPRAAVNLGILLGTEGDIDSAKAAYRLAIDSGHPDIAPRAALSFGNLVRQQGDFSGARAAYRIAIDSGHTDAAPQAAFNLGILLSREGDTDGAIVAYEEAIDSGHPAHAPKAAHNLGILLSHQGDTDGAAAAYQVAIDSGHAEQVPTASLNLGRLLAARGDIEGARNAYQLAIDSGHADLALAAAVDLGVLLGQEGDAKGARAAYQLAIDSKNPAVAPAAALNLGILLEKEGDPEGARAAYRIAIESAHPYAAPAAQRRLHELS